ncbi:MAG: arsenosugar biosynthesis radical SAM protein ArsS [Desulfobacterales bacterium]|nr:arsenosugar biosynthesis radical SAM protein ArsS [Desulfobacterales bacterium]
MMLNREKNSFRQTLASHGIRLTRGRATTLQVNVGLLCNQSCHHCHLNAGPGRDEVMGQETIDQVVALAGRFRFETIDITGGAPEMNPHISDLLRRLAPLAPTVILRSNLTAVSEPGRRHLLDLCSGRRITIVASFPSLNRNQAESQRGPGVFDQSLATLKELNKRGYGRPGSGLSINLVVNPAGAFLPGSQARQEKQFHRALEKKWGIAFNNLYTFANMPLGRFRAWLEKTGNLEGYLQKLTAGFNPCATDGLMCRTMISVAWDGTLFDCDFNQAAGLFLNNVRTHISEIDELPRPGTEIMVADHCYTCTAGAGFT